MISVEFGAPYYLRPFVVIDFWTAPTTGIWAKLKNAPISSTKENITPCDWFGKDKLIPVDSNE